MRPEAAAPADLRPEVLAVLEYGCAPADAPRPARDASARISPRGQSSVAP